MTKNLSKKNFNQLSKTLDKIYVKSPLNYIGGKYKLLNKIIKITN